MKVDWQREDGLVAAVHKDIVVVISVYDLVDGLDIAEDVDVAVSILIASSLLPGWRADWCVISIVIANFPWIWSLPSCVLDGVYPVFVFVTRVVEVGGGHALIVWLVREVLVPVHLIPVAFESFMVKITVD